jgi:hypothetical protein
MSKTGNPTPLFRELADVPGLARPEPSDPLLGMEQRPGDIGEARHRPETLTPGGTRYVPVAPPSAPSPFPAAAPPTVDDLDRQAGAEPPLDIRFDCHDAAGLGVSLVVTAAVPRGDESARVSSTRARLGPRRLEAMLRQAAKAWAASEPPPPELAKLREHDAAAARLDVQVKRLEARQQAIGPEINSAVARGDEARRKELQAERRTLAEDLDALRPAAGELAKRRGGLFGLCQQAQRKAVEAAFATIKAEAAKQYGEIVEVVRAALVGRTMRLFVVGSMLERCRHLSATTQDWAHDFVSVK